MFLKRNSTFTSGFATEPYEVAWAGEAVWFIRIFDWEGENTSLRLKVQILSGWIGIGAIRVKE